MHCQLDKKPLECSLPTIIQTDVPLADKNWFRTGGAARYFAEPGSADEFAGALAFAKEHGLAITLLGQGANVLISDDGVDGLVIRPRLCEIRYENVDDTHVHVTAGAGVTVHDLIVDCLEHRVLGLEEFSGIPGTVGGSVYINLHYFQFYLGQFLKHAQVIERATGLVRTVDAAWFAFGYDESTLQNEAYYLVCATFALRRCSELEAAYAQGRRVEIIRHRLSRYPATHTCGSFFRNFHPHEVTLESNGKKMIFVAYYLDKIGVKGTLSCGDAIVSHQHANMLVNRGHATSTDIINLAHKMQEMVKETFGIVPEAECRLLGFKEKPLW